MNENKDLDMNRTSVNDAPEDALNIQDAQPGETGLTPEDVPVSMNMFGFTPSIIEEMRATFPVFHQTTVKQNPLKAEFYLPFVVSNLLNAGKATVKVLRTPAKWFGVTYAADKPQVVASLKEMADKGLYPDGLWK